MAPVGRDDSTLQQYAWSHGNSAVGKNFSFEGEMKVGKSFEKYEGPDMGEQTHITFSIFTNYEIHGTMRVAILAGHSSTYSILAISFILND